MDQAERAGNEGVGQFEIEFLDLWGQHQALVDDGAAGEGRHVEVVLAFDVGGCHLVFGAAAYEIKQALEALFIQAVGAADEELLDIWLGGAGFAANGIAVHGGVAPAEDLEALFGRDALEDAFALQTAVLVNGKEDHSHAVCARLRQLNAEFAALAREEDVRNLNQNSGAIARLRIAACGSAMGEVDEDLETLADDVVALFASMLATRPIPHASCSLRGW